MSFFRFIIKSFEKTFVYTLYIQMCVNYFHFQNDDVNFFLRRLMQPNGRINKHVFIYLFFFLIFRLRIIIRGDCFLRSSTWKRQYPNRISYNKSAYSIADILQIMFITHWSEGKFNDENKNALKYPLDLKMCKSP